MWLQWVFMVASNHTHMLESRNAFLVRQCPLFSIEYVSLQCFHLDCQLRVTAFVNMNMNVTNPSLVQSTFYGAQETAASLHHLSEHGQNTVLTIMAILGSNFPDLEYSPYLMHLVSFILSTTRSADHALSIAWVMTERSRKDEWYFPLSRFRYAVFLMTFLDMIRKKNARLLKKMEQLDINPTAFVRDFFDNFFLLHLNYHEALIVMDSFLLEGSKVLYRVGLAVLKEAEGEMLGSSSRDEFSQALHAYLSSHTVWHILKTGFSLYLARSMFYSAHKKNEKALRDVRDSSVDLGDVDPFYHPAIRPTSVILDTLAFDFIWAHLPPRFRIRDADRVYSATEDGYGLSRLLAKVAEVLSDRREHVERSTEMACIIVVTTMKGDVFGGFTTEPWHHYSSSKFFGTGESLLFALKPSPMIYTWHSDNPSTYMFCTTNSLGMGSSEKGYGLFLDESMQEGSTAGTDTFSSQPLASEANYEVANVELYELAP